MGRWSIVTRRGPKGPYEIDVLRGWVEEGRLPDAARVVDVVTGETRTLRELLDGIRSRARPRPGASRTRPRPAAPRARPTRPVHRVARRRTAGPGRLRPATGRRISRPGMHGRRLASSRGGMVYVAVAIAGVFVVAVLRGVVAAYLQGEESPVLFGLGSGTAMTTMAALIALIGALICGANAKVFAGVMVVAFLWTGGSGLIGLLGGQPFKTMQEYGERVEISVPRRWQRGTEPDQPQLVSYNRGIDGVAITRLDADLVSRSLSDFEAVCLRALDGIGRDWEISAPRDASIGGLPATRRDVAGVVGEFRVRGCQVVARSRAAFYQLLVFVSESRWEYMEDDVERVVRSFREL